VAGRQKQQRVTVRRRLGGERRAERAAGAAAVIDYDRLAQLSCSFDRVCGR
jgi:hypothetical protein